MTPDFSLHALADGAIVSPFTRLRVLLDGIEPGHGNPIDLTLGEPRETMPAGLHTLLSEHPGDLAKYPKMQGIEPLRRAIADWHRRRYGQALELDPEKHILPTNGSREGLLFAGITAVAAKKTKARPAMLMCNPFYQAYLGAALVTNCEPVFLNATAATGHLPDLKALSAIPALLDRAAALFICSPSNPQGATASESYLQHAIELVRRHDVMLFVDECYSEIYSDAPPPGALATALARTGSLKNVVTFNSLSKRSNLPGLRSAFVAGDPDFLARLFEVRNLIAPQCPVPIQRAAACAWSDDAHVEANRMAYRKKFDLADSMLGARSGYQRPDGGFFLWLDVRQYGGAGDATVTLWKRFGVKVIPGAFLAQDDAAGNNPGDGYIRVALVHDLATTREAFERLVKFFA